MAIEIKSIPTLIWKEAGHFVKEADKAFQNRGKIDYSKHIRETYSLLKRLTFEQDFSFISNQ